MVQEIHVQDQGTIFRVQLCDGTNPVDISSATDLQIDFRKADGTILNASATLTNGGTDGKLQYTTVADDLNIAGSWKIQAKVTLPAGTWKSDIGLFTVHSNLE